MLRVPSEINAKEFESLKMQETTFIAYRSDVYPAKNEVFFEENAIIYVLEGEKKFTSPSQNVHVKKGDVLFVRRGYYLMSESINESYRSLVFFFDEKLLKEFAANSIELFELGVLKNSISSDSLLIFHTNQRFEKFIETVFPYFQTEKTPYLNQFLRLKYQEILLHLLTFDTEHSFKKLLHTVYKGQKTELNYLMKDYFLKPLTLDELAKISGRSLSTFKRDFFAEFGTSPASWIKTKRLEHASFLLKNSTQNISEISQTIGYESVSHFIKAFKAMYGNTPKRTK